jgi:hypothetical protein
MACAKVQLSWSPPTTDAPAYSSPPPLVPVYAGAFFFPGGTRHRGAADAGSHIAALPKLSDFITAEVAMRRAHPDRKAKRR